MTTRIKILLGFLLGTVIVISFLLGRFSTKFSKRTHDIQIITTASIQKLQSKEKETNEQNIQLRASSRGNKYYFPWCVSTFAEENTIYFDSIEEAEKAGYEKATGCLETQN